jgi:outer membrane protein assembly factor BamB
MSSTAIEPVPTPSVIHPNSPGVRVWFPIVLLSVYWGAVLFIHNTDMAMLPRFISRCVAWAITLLAFLGWWLFNRRINLRDRFAAVAWFIVILVVAGILGHPTIIPVLAIQGVPTLLTVCTIWLIVSRPWSKPARRIGFLAVLPLTLIPFEALRCEGIDGFQRTTVRWRWTQSAEEQFLASKPDAVLKPIAAGREWTVRPDDWPAFRGVNRDAVVTGVRLADDWSTQPPRLIWKQRIGPGWSSLIVVDGFLFTQEQRDAAEAIVCYDASTGREAWSYEAPGRFNEPVSGLGPRATPAFDRGRIYALGATGLLSCVSAETGESIWSRDVKTDAGAKVPQWGYSSSPLVHEGLVYVFAGGDGGKSLIAYQAESGDIAWTCNRGKLSYSSPQLIPHQGDTLILMQDNKSVAAVRASDGVMVWERPNGNETEEPMIQPHLLRGALLFSAGSGMARVDLEAQAPQWTITDRWKSNSVKPDFNDVAVLDGSIYGLDDGILCCVDLETGRRRWKQGRYGHGQLILLADQTRLLIATESGEIVQVAARPDRFEELGRFQAIEGKLWNHPVIAEGSLFVRNGEEIACFELQAKPGK